VTIEITGFSAVELLARFERATSSLPK